ncbi:prepilin-type N-terminal cleavage/methylation domain-containing protein [uncultured Neptuniibacter sp.]|uniref:prepilin-type N-terminal cleavage/methylation domain-containing protein n=1 Tax=uncultured Neptuniibacter sp. TaxID=502143 RepID=UPI002611100D|nr:prepilin-type N-terminal cleavage/methylation domain-containing protein [uncultured Neptuniibacter sp.]
MGCTGRVTQTPVGPRFHQRGFTLVEIIVVIILLGILSAVAIPRFSDTSTFESASLRSSILGSLKLAQKTALAQHASSVYWVLSRPAETQWQLQLLIDSDSSDGNPPTDITPTQLSTPISAPSMLNFNVSLAAGGAVAGSVGTSDNLVILFNQLGDMVRVKTNVVLTSEASFPGSAQQVDSSLQFADGSGDFCLSLTGYSYASTCR